AEFFGDLTKSSREKCWGATFKLEVPKGGPAPLFAVEVDHLVQRLHARGLMRMVAERSGEAREKLCRFPIEFSALKRNLCDLIATTFQPNEIETTPIFRGFYFTSGTQEGRPVDRVLERMREAMGIRSEARHVPQRTESKSYFL